MKNCVIRTYGKGYYNQTSDLAKKLNDGWIVKSGIPFVTAEGKTEYIEYILEKE